MLGKLVYLAFDSAPTSVGSTAANAQIRSKAGRRGWHKRLVSVPLIAAMLLTASAPAGAGADITEQVGSAPSGIRSGADDVESQALDEPPPTIDDLPSPVNEPPPAERGRDSRGEDALETPSESGSGAASQVDPGVVIPNTGPTVIDYELSCNGPCSIGVPIVGTRSDKDYSMLVYDEELSRSDGHCQVTFGASNLLGSFRSSSQLGNGVIYPCYGAFSPEVFRRVRYPNIADLGPGYWIDPTIIIGGWVDGSGPFQMSGSVTIWLFEFDPDDGQGYVDPGGGPVTIEYQAPWLTETRSFYGVQGDTFELRITDNTIPPQCNLWIVSPAGGRTTSSCDRSTPLTMGPLSRSGIYKITLSAQHDVDAFESVIGESVTIDLERSSYGIDESCIGAGVYPIMLVHGFNGSSEDWNRIRSFLRYRVESELVNDADVPLADAVDCSELMVRAIEVERQGSSIANSQIIREQLEELALLSELVGGDERRVDVIAHSKGGLDTRLAIELSMDDPQGAGQLSNRSNEFGVFNLVTIGTPHRGTPIADLGCGYYNGPFPPLISGLIRDVIRTNFGPCDDRSDALWGLTVEHVNGTLNQVTQEQQNLIFYSSIAGDSECTICRLWRNLFPVYMGPNDRLVPVYSASGVPDRGFNFVGTFPYTHGPETGGMLDFEEVGEAAYCELAFRKPPDRRGYQSEYCQNVDSTLASESRAVALQPESPDLTESVLAGVHHVDAIAVPAGQDVSLQLPSSDGSGVLMALADQSGLSASIGDIDLGAVDEPGRMLAADIDHLDGAELELSNPTAEDAAVLVVVTSETAEALDIVTSPDLPTIGDPMEIRVPNPGGSPPTTGLTGTLTAEDGTTEQLEFEIDGTDAVAPFTPSNPGEYAITIENNLQTRRVASTRFLVAAGVASLPGTFSDSIEQSPDGLADTLNVDVDVDVTHPGVYRLAATLERPDGTVVTSAAAIQELGSGSHTMRLEYPGAALYASGHNGAYEFKDMTLLHVINDEYTLEARHPDAGTTAPYNAEAFRAVTVVPGFATVPDAEEGEIVVAEVPVQLSQPVTFPVTVDYQSFNDDPNFAQAPEDFEAVSGTLTFQPGETTKAVPVTINGDRLDPGQDTLKILIQFDNPTNATVGGFFGLGAIDIIRAVTVVPGFATVPDAEEGEIVVAEVPVQLSQPVTFPVTVDYQSFNDDPNFAQAPEDFEAVSGTLTFQPGETTKAVPVTINGDRLDPGQDTLKILIQFDNPTNATVGGFFGLGAIDIIRPD